MEQVPENLKEGRSQGVRRPEEKVWNLPPTPPSQLWVGTIKGDGGHRPELLPLAEVTPLPFEAGLLVHLETSMLNWEQWSFPAERGQKEAPLPWVGE